jgi:hypothetical protein
MAKPMFDPTELIAQFETATVNGSEQLRQAVSSATLQALKGREMTLSNIKGALKTVAEAASQGAARNLNPGVDPQALLDKAVGGMDDALLKTVEAHRAALQSLAAQGADLKDKHLKRALSDLEKMEDTMFDVLKKAAAGAATPMAAAWGQVLEKTQMGGTQAGATASATAQDLIAQMQTGMRETRAASLKAAEALAQGYSAMVSGVLLGMAEALKSAPAAPAKSAASKKK